MVCGRHRVARLMRAAQTSHPKRHQWNPMTTHLFMPAPYDIKLPPCSGDDLFLHSVGSIHQRWNHSMLALAGLGGPDSCARTSSLRQAQCRRQAERLHRIEIVPCGRRVFPYACDATCAPRHAEFLDSVNARGDGRLQTESSQTSRKIAVTFLKTSRRFAQILTTI